MLFRMKKVHTLWSISLSFINISILLLNQLVTEHFCNKKAGIETLMYSENVLKSSNKEKSFLTLVFISFSTVPLIVSVALLLFIFLYPLKVKLFLQDCLLATLLTEFDPENQRELESVTNGNHAMDNHEGGQ